MTIKELSTIFHGSVVVERTVATGTHSIRFDELYDGKLAKLADETILSLTIKVVENIPGSTIRNGIPFLRIIVN